MRRFIILFIALSALAAGCGRMPGPEVVDNPKVVIIMYHRITEGKAENLYERSAADFEKDLLYLLNNNISVIDFQQLEEIVSGRIELNRHAAIITFDDGDHSWYTRAAPLLKKYRMKATFFLWTSRMGMNSFLSWDEVKLMSNYAYEGGERPFAFGSHTSSHHMLLEKKEALGGGVPFADYLDEELGGSKRLIESHINGSVDALALPFGDGAGDEDIIASALRHGYRFIRTSERNITGTPATDLWRLPALPLLDDTKPELIGGYLGIE